MRFSSSGLRSGWFSSIFRQSGSKTSITFCSFSYSDYADIRGNAKRLGLGEALSISLNRETRCDGRTERIAIATNMQLELELPSIVSGIDKLQGNDLLFTG